MAARSARTLGRTQPVQPTRRMNATQFVSALVEHVHEPSIADVVASLESPPGRRPRPRDIDLSKWYSGLSEHDQSRLAQVIGYSVHATLFGVLCVLDGVRRVHDSEVQFRLVSEESGQVTLINEPNSEALHDIYQGFVQEQVLGSR
jgi:hypothetical protein